MNVFRLLILLFFLPLASEGSSWFSSLQSQGSKFLGGGSKFLQPEEAFKVKMSAIDGHTLAADFTPADGYYLYKARISFDLISGDGLKILKTDFPKGEEKDDPNLGRTEVFHHPFRATVDLERSSNASGKLAITATYQGCSSEGLCYSPMTSRFDLVLPQAGAGASAPVEGSNESSRIGSILKGGNFWLIIASFAGFGLLLSLTPCTFPMIPILSGIIVGHGEHLNRSRGLILSSTYVLGLAIVYAAAGIFAGYSGTLLSNLLQNPWTLGSFSLIFVLLAFSMFGFYEFQLPTFLQSKLSDASNTLHGGHIGGVFLMGALSALIVGPCCAAPLAAALLYIGKTHDLVLGGSALFAMGLGMGFPLILVGLSAGSLLPKAGPWMQSVKNFFGVTLIALSIWMVSPLLPALASMLLWAALLIISAIYLHAIDPLPPGASGFRRLWKGIGVICLLLGAALLVGALSGNRDVLQPLSGFRTATAAAPESLRFLPVKTIAELDAKIGEAKGRMVMLDFYADWCVSCKEMDRFTFTDPKVQAKLAGALLLRADVTANSSDDAELLKRFGLYGPPGIMFFDRNGKELADSRVIGSQDAETFLATLNGIAS